MGDGSDTDQRRLAYQLAFELEDNASQQLLQAVAKALPQSDDATAPVSIMRSVLGGRVSVDLYLAFLYRCCKADSQILREAKAAVEYVEYCLCFMLAFICVLFYLIQTTFFYLS